MSFDDGIHERPELSSDPLASWPAFTGAVRARLEAGRRAYGDSSFGRPTPELLTELEQEALDLAGWGFVLWFRLRALRAAAEQVEDAAPRAKAGSASPEYTCGPSPIPGRDPSPNARAYAPSPAAVAGGRPARLVGPEREAAIAAARGHR